MKILFIEARKKFSGKVKIKNNLPKKLHILYIIQYKNLAEKLMKILKKRGHKISAFQQILGCSKIKLNKNLDKNAALLLVGSGRFHALSLINSVSIIDFNREIYIYDGKISRIPKQEIERIKKKEKGKIAKFLASENIGLLVSEKIGQNKLLEAIKIKEKLEKKFKEKKFYFFLADTIDTKELENFPCFFVNFACPGIELDSNKIINYEKIKEILEINL